MTQDELLKYAGPFATTIASIAALIITTYFARHQKKSTRDKIRLDLFDRRLEILSSVLDFYKHMISWESTPEQISAQNRLLKAYHASIFLFPKDSGIEDLLKSLNDQGVKVIGFKENGEELRHDKDLYLRLFNQSQDIQIRAFPEGLTQLKNAMEKYMSFHDL